MQAGKTKRMTDERSRLIKLVHVGRKQLGLAEDLYRDMLEAVTGQRSAAKLSIAQLQDVLAHMRRKGFQVKAKRGELTPSEGKLWALWYRLAELGGIQEATSEALAAWVKGQVGVDHWQWATNAQMDRLIEQAKAWVKRLEAEKGARDGT